MTGRARIIVMAVTITLLWNLVGCDPAGAHAPDEQTDWWADWNHRTRIAGGLTSDLLAEAVDFARKHGEHDEVGSSRTRTPLVVSSSAEPWRDLVAAHFPADAVDTMLCLLWAESRGDPGAVNPSSGAAGLFQIMPFWWDHYGGDRFDPATNVRVARLIWDQQGYGAWSPWNRGACR